MYRFSEIENDIHALCAEDLLNEIKKAEGELHASLTDWLEGLQTDLTGEAYSSIEDFLSVLETNITDFEHSFINQSGFGTSLYVRLVEQLAENLPDEIEIEQDEGRFLSMAEDRAWTSAVKGGKRAVRGMQRAFDSTSNFLKKMAGKEPGSTREYIQKVPLKRLVQYHFYKNESAATQYSDFWNQVKLQLLADLEQVLIDTVQEEESLQDAEQLKERFTQFTEKKIEQLDEKLSQNRKQWLEYSVDLEKKITHAARRVDTIEHSSRHYRPDLVENMQNDVEAMITNRKKRWTEAQQQVIKKLHPLIDFFAYNHDMEARFQQLIHEVNRYAESLLIEPVSAIISSVKKTQNRIKKDESEGDPQLQQHHDELLQAMQNKLLKPLSQALETNRFERLLDQYIEQALLRTNKLREEIELYYGARWEDFPPSYEVSALQWQSIVTRRLNEELLNVLRQNKKDVRKKLEAYYNEFQEVYDVIKVNLETSSGAEDKSEKESAEEVAIEGLERSISKLEADLEPIKEDYAKLEETLQNQVNEFKQQLLSLLTAKGASDFQLIDTSYRMRKTTSDLKTQVEAKSERLQDKVELFFRFSWRKIKKWNQQVSRFLGFKTEQFQRKQKADIATYLSETDQRLQELPFVYRKLFSREAALERKFFVAPHESFGKLTKAYEMWNKEFGAACAVVGEKGAGKTTFIDLALEDLDSKESRKKISLDETIWTEQQLLNIFASQAGIKAESTQQLIEKLNKGKTRKIMVLENIQNGYLRNINGYEALINLLLVISETKDSVFWVISCSTYAWNLLDKVESVGEYFSHIVTTDRLDKQQIQSVILKRHKVSGFELKYEADEFTKKSRAFRKLGDDEVSTQKYLEDQYFEKLAELAKGNASIALIIWIRSIREYDETHFYIRPLEVASVEVIDNLKPDVLFTLAALVLHDTLTAEELAKAVNIDERQAKLILARLEAKGLLQQEESRFALNHLMYRQVVDLLKQRNILHLV